MVNVLSVDVEDYFHVEAFAAHVSRSDWHTFVPRVERNMDVILETLDRYGVRATFFVLGWVGERFPGIVRRVAQCGHEVACHGSGHEHITRQSPAQFRSDVRRARRGLMLESGQPVRAFRAPSFSIVRDTLWALDILVEEGFTIDSSIFPARHDIYGIADAPRFPHWRQTPKGNLLFEFPPSTVRLGSNNYGVGGGGYLRLIPYPVTRRTLGQINKAEKQPVMVYFHPWEIDADQPRIPAGFRSRFRHYTNLSTMQNKIERLLQDFQFTTLADACEQLEAYRQKKSEVLSRAPVGVQEVVVA